MLATTAGGPPARPLDDAFRSRRSVGASLALVSATALIDALFGSGIGGANRDFHSEDLHRSRHAARQVRRGKVHPQVMICF